MVMGTQVYLAFDADHAGRVIGDARMRDDPDLLRKVSSKIDAGNELFKTWATNQGGSSISAGGDEGVIAIPATALSDLQSVKEQYEKLLELTVSIGLGVSMSQAFKSLMAAKLRGRNKTIFYDKSVEEEVQAAIKEESKDDSKKKIVDEYLSKSELSKAQTIHHTGKGGPQNDVKGAPESNPEIQQQQDIAGMPDIQSPNFEAEFRTIADASEKKDLAEKAQRSSDFKALKAKVSDALLAIHQQMPQLAQIKQAAPDTYAAILGVVKGVIALGQEIQNSEQKLAKSMDFVTNPNEPPKAMLGVGSGLGALDKMDLVPGGIADKFQPSHFDQEQLAIGTMRELEHTDDEDLAREIAMDHLAEDPDYYKIDEEEPLEKMALMHDDEARPVTVYRVQNAKGEGPYHTESYRELLSIMTSLPTRRTPGPEEDFPKKDLKETSSDADPYYFFPKREIRFGFHSPEAAQKWFGKEALASLAERGFRLTPVKAKKAWISKTKRQVMFIPHSSEKILSMAKSDWPMAEKEELDPSEAPPADNVLDKGAVPEHIKSVAAKGRLIPGTALDGRHVVVKNASGKNVVRQVAAGMQRDLNDSESNPVGPGLGNPTSTRNKPSQV